MYSLFFFQIFFKEKKYLINRYRKMLNTLLTAVPKPDPVLFVRIRLKRPDRNLYYVTAAVPKILYWGS